MESTLKFSATRGGAYVTEVAAIMSAVGINFDHVDAIYKGGPEDKSVYVTFTDDAALQFMRQVQNLYFENKTYSCHQLGKQIINVKIHWLPEYINNSFVESEMSEFGTVKSIEKCVAHDTKLKSGIRLVKLEVTEREEKDTSYY